MHQFFLLASFLCCVLLGSPLRAESLRVGFFELAPHVRAGGPGQEASGPAVDYLRAVAAKMGVEVRIDSEALPLNRLLYLLDKGEVDLALALGRNPEREHLGNYPPRPFFSIQPAIAVPQQSPLSAPVHQKTLRTLRIGVYAAGYMSPLMQAADLQKEPLFGSEVVVRNLRKMLLGRLDAVYSPDSWDLRAAAVREGLSARIRILPLAEAPLGLYTVFSRRLGPLLLQRYDRALSQVGPYGPYLEKNAQQP